MTVTTPEFGTAPVRDKRYINSKLVDFFCLGGGSLPFLALLAFLPPDDYKIYVVAFAWFLGNFINHPHFIHSYQIFYDGFRDKLKPGAPLRERYIVAGIVVPVLMALYFAVSILTLNITMLGNAAAVMLFLVGWHYTKQGYGILMVESAMKKMFFSDEEKRWLRYNAITVWIMSWIYVNLSLTSKVFHGYEYILFGFPDWVHYVSIASVVVTSAMCLRFLVPRALSGNLPWNGVIAYVTTCYIWLVLARIHPLGIVVVPAFHSLQYLAIVWRYQLNKSHASEQGSTRLFYLYETSAARAAMIKFVLYGIILGAFLFYAIPFALDFFVAYPREVFGGTLFIFTFSIFINVHHYFLDNVMWRRENPNIKKHLFS